ncbi:LysR substrate-binding domain-containing protein [Hellea sp.]|nr:LysR substrate-binding domain-containing protein [Hellea sp.]MDA8888566.1 LysR substrate-binding domain-containing protein [Hellea sp.]MDA8996742.1 LysR substrate-binding domain-containing protein [Hellea sp.]MDB4844976.1 LysR substrate-binding domain-containing protein [Hellea sp.]
MTPDISTSISLRHLKVVLCLAEVGNVTKASHLLLRSRTAVSKSLRDLERQIATKIFNRASSGFDPTDEGNALLTRAKVISDIFSRLSKSYQLTHKRPKKINNIPLFTMDIATKRLVQLALLSNTESIEAAAQLGKLSTSAIYKSINELENTLDIPLFARLPNGRIIPVGFGEVLCQQVKLVLSQLRHIVDDIKTIRGQHDGLLRIGSLPSMQSYVLPVALAKLAKTHPEISIHVDTRPYPEMEKDLLSGELDVIIGGTRSGVNTDGLKTEVLAEDQVYVVAGAHHPLAKKNAVTKEDLNDVTWVFPVSGTPAREVFTKRLNESGVYPEKIWIESVSITSLRGILMSSEAVMMGTKYQTHYEQTQGFLTLLPFPLDRDNWPLGLTLHKDAPPPKSLDFYLKCHREALEDVQSGVTLDSHGQKFHSIAI